MRDRAFTILELALVVAILAILGAILTPQLASTDVHQKLEFGASEVASALRFARSEAMRTGEPYGIHASVATQVLRVFHWTDSHSGLDYSVRHPVDKKLYRLQFGSDPGLERIELKSVEFDYSDLASPYEFLVFNASGAPELSMEASRNPLVTAELRIAYADGERVIRVAPVTGRVSVE